MMMLYVFESPSCSVCQEAEPHLKAFEKELHGKMPIIRLNPNLRDWRIGSFHPKYTPSYALAERSNLLGAVEGQLLTLEQLRAFHANPGEFARERKAARKAAAE